MNTIRICICVLAVACIASGRTTSKTSSVHSRTASATNSFTVSLTSVTVSLTSMSTSRSVATGSTTLSSTSLKSMEQSASITPTPTPSVEFTASASLSASTQSVTSSIGSAGLTGSDSLSFSGPSQSLTATRTTSPTTHRTSTDSSTVTISLTITASASLSGTATLSESRFAFAPRIDRCFTEQALYAGSPFSITVTGFQLTDEDTFLIVQDRLQCSNASLWETYHHFYWVHPDNFTAVLHYTVADSKPFGVCFLGVRHMIAFSMSCQQFFYPSIAVAPWSDKVLLSTLASRLVVAGGNQTLATVNGGHCISSHLPGGYAHLRGVVSAGPLLNPVGMSAQFGNASQRVAVAETCVFYIDQVQVSGEDEVLLSSDHDKVNGINVSSVRNLPYEVTINSLLSPSDALILFTADTLPYTAVLNASSASDPSLSAPSSCLLAGGMNGMVAVRRFDFGVTTIRLPPQPFALVACSAVDGSRGLYASMTYRRVLTLCPDDCRDGSGVEHGECTNTTGQCECFAGYSGPDCSTPTDCGRVGDVLVTRNVTGGSGTLSMTNATHCGVLLRADGSNLDRSGGFWIGLRVSALHLNISNASLSFVAIRKDIASGAEIHRFDASDMDVLNSDASPVLFIVGSRSVFVEYMGSGVNDSVTVDFTSVSIMCPGEIDITGRVYGATNTCGGLGVCVDVDFEPLRYLPSTAKTCACREPYAPSSLASSCDQCAKNRDPWTFPTCVALPKCPWDCNNRGECTADGCVCRAPYYGTICELSATDSHLQASSRLVSRLALDSGSGASGRNSNVFLSCQVTGCTIARRNVGMLFGSAATVGMQTSLTADPRGAPAVASQQSNQTTTRSYRSMSTASSVVNVTSDSFDEGLLLNAIRVPGSVGDYVAQSNI